MKKNSAVVHFPGFLLTLQYKMAPVKLVFNFFLNYFEQHQIFIYKNIYTVISISITNYKKIIIMVSILTATYLSVGNKNMT